MVNHGNMYGPSFTFLGIPQCDLDDPKSFADADVIIVGAPIDSGTSHRSGAKFGPQAIRGGDYLPHDAERPHLALRIDALKALKVYDAGDLMMPPGDLVSSLKVLEEAQRKFHVLAKSQSSLVAITRSHQQMWQVSQSTAGLAKFP